MKKVSIHQPCYIPYMGVFHKIWNSDVFVFLDDAQYSNGYVFDWNRIKTPQGECRLKVPTNKRFRDLLTEVTLNDNIPWREKHLKIIEMNYKRAPYFDEVFYAFRECIMGEYMNLAELNIATMEMFLKKLGVRVTVHRTSELGIKSTGEQRVIDTVLAVGGDTYLSGNGGKNYQCEKNFANAGIDLVYPDYKIAEYRQQWGEFIPNLSVLDYCMNEGFDSGKAFGGGGLDEE